MAREQGDEECIGCCITLSELHIFQSDFTASRGELNSLLSAQLSRTPSSAELEAVKKVIASQGYLKGKNGRASLQGYLLEILGEGWCVAETTVLFTLLL